MLHHIMEALNTLSANVSQLDQQVTGLARPPPADSLPPSAADPVQSPPPHTREPFVLPPEHYSRDIGACSAFLLQCSYVFNLQPNSYATDKSHALYVMSLLKGRAAQWGTALWEGKSPILDLYASFVREMRKVFDHPVQGSVVASSLFALRQGFQSAANHAIEFRILAAETVWKEPALVSLFRHGLSDELQDELAAREEPETLEQLVALVIKLDNHLRERQRERSSSSRRMASSPLSQSPTSPPKLPASSHPPSAPRALPAAPEEPMQVGRSRLTPEERQRLQNLQLCIYCGQPGHFLTQCPALTKEPAHH